VSLTTALAVFVLTALLDVVWTFYVQGLAEKKKWQAAGAAGLIVLFGAFNTVSIVDDPWLALPAACGAIVGTLIAVERSR
jgi:hypothetical protein